MRCSGKALGQSGQPSVPGPLGAEVSVPCEDTAQVSLRPEDLCAGGTARLLQSEKRSQMVMPSASRVPSPPGPDGCMRTWDISISPELVRKVAPVRWLWTPTPHKKDPGHCFQDGEMALHRAAASACCLSDLGPRTR